MVFKKNQEALQHRAIPYSFSKFLTFPHEPRQNASEKFRSNENSDVISKSRSKTKFSESVWLERKNAKLNNSTPVTDRAWTLGIGTCYYLSRSRYLLVSTGESFLLQSPSEFQPDLSSLKSQPFTRIFFTSLFINSYYKSISKTINNTYFGLLERIKCRVCHKQYNSFNSYIFTNGKCISRQSDRSVASASNGAS